MIEEYSLVLDINGFPFIYSKSGEGHVFQDEAGYLYIYPHKSKVMKHVEIIGTWKEYDDYWDDDYHDCIF